MSVQSSSSAANVSSSRRPSRRRHGENACEFCRLRKLGCDQERPACQNCKKRSIACEYAARPYKARPSYATIEKLTKENAALKAQLQAQQQQQQEQQHHAVHALPSSATLSDSRPVPQAIARDLTRATTPLIHRLSGDAERTGASIDDFSAPTASTLINTLRKDHIDSLLVAYQKAQLMAETAKHRHLEKLHLRQGTSRFTRFPAAQITALLNIFWSRQHATGSIIYRTAFTRDMAATPHGPYFSPLLLQAMLLFALRCSPSITGSGLKDTCLEDGTDVSSSSASVFRAEFERLLAEDNGRMMLVSRVTTIQALLLMSDVLFAWLDERAVAWHYLSLAVSMIIDLGMHEEQHDVKEDCFAGLERSEVHRRVFWGAFILDKMQSIYQGRPPRLRHTDCTIPIHFLDESEESEPFRTDGFSISPLENKTPTYGVSIMKCLCGLSVVADGIISEVYSAKPGQHGHEQRYAIARNSLQMQLDQWWEFLPPQFKVKVGVGGRLGMESDDEPLPHVLSLLSLYHALTILLHRPFVTETASFEPHLTPSSALHICHHAALSISSILQCYDSQYCMIAPPYFLTYATYASATIHVRVAAQQPEVTPPYEPLLGCLEMLSIQGRRNGATARMARVLLSLVDKLGVEVGGVITEDGLWERKEAWPGSVEASDEYAGMMSNGDYGVVDWSSMMDFFFDIDPLVGFQGLNTDLEGNLNGTQ